MSINNVDYSALSADADMEDAVKDEIAAGVLEAAGGNLNRSHVVVTLSQGSVIAHVTIRVPEPEAVAEVDVSTSPSAANGTASHSAQPVFSSASIFAESIAETLIQKASSGTLADTVIEKVSNVPQISSVTTGAIEVAAVTSPDVRILTTTRTTTTSTTTTLPNRVPSLEEETFYPNATDHLETYDWDALEFSPVYQCLQAGRFYSQINSSCVFKCPGNTDASHGQCVRPNTEESHSNFTGLWKLHTDCGPECWAQKSEVSIHFLRLALADHLDIPFQEVGRILLRRSVTATSDRRLQQSEATVQHAYLDISVSSRRHTAESGNRHLEEFLSDSLVASQLLGVAVHSLEHLDENRLSEYQADFSSEPVPGEDGDVFAPYYDELVPQTDDESGDVAFGGVSLLLLILIGAATALAFTLGIICITVRRCRRRRKPLYEVDEWVVVDGYQPGQGQDGSWDAEKGKEHCEADHFDQEFNEAVFTARVVTEEPPDLMEEGYSRPADYEGEGEGDPVADIDIMDEGVTDIDMHAGQFGFATHQLGEPVLPNKDMLPKEDTLMSF
jgi:hypothetical protein